MRGNRWDIFCRVVDNFGDIGFCWRLARQLASEHGLRVRLWVDDLASFRRLCPDLDPLLGSQNLRSVEIRHWATPFQNADVDTENTIADVVIEAFACELPPDYLAAMASRLNKPVWLNLEYLSAENWVAGCHGRASPHPRLALTKHFFFPGFAPETGGLLRERDLLRQRADGQADPAAAWQGLGLPAAQPEERSVSLFCYDNPVLPELLNLWAEDEAPWRCLIPLGQASAQVANILQSPPLEAGDMLRQGNLSIYALPFLSQENYDRLLWSCDLNFVRGEDSFVRAQWAAKPFVWQIYPQPEAAHHAKLDAFLGRYCVGLKEPVAAACRAFWQVWNQANQSDLRGTWPAYWRHHAELSAHARNWAESLAKQPDLASKLVSYCKNLL